MIRRDRTPNSWPTSLNPTGQDYIDEFNANQEKVVGNVAKPWKNLSKSLVFKLYAKDHDVKKALSDLFGNKCAYCECSLDNQDLHTEHFRPKASVDAIDNPTGEGYWWLAAAWENLLPACNHCNRSPGTDHVTLAPSMSGKGNRFPLLDESQRAKSPGLEGNERPSLIDPTLDEPASYISFTDFGGLNLVDKVANDPASDEWRRADATISIYGLNREGLARRRNEYLKPLRVLLRIYIRAVGVYNAVVTENRLPFEQAAARDEMTALWDEIFDTYLSSERKEYLHAAVSCIDAQFHAAGLSLSRLLNGQPLYLPAHCLR
ncbi:hypothetical protein [Duganella sp. Leaf61]|uniref:hypothetical protein n=1 Tax=Duganella sp. Leaf61 TaxID=1736227 RepID=UPI000A86951B|nr:hypothetical protein [Duganella sp. Leaf61]